MKVKYTHSAMPFKQMENIATFLHALSKLPNFRSFDLFSTVDLYEGKNMASVTRCILACKRIAEKEAGKEVKDVEMKPDLSVKETAKFKDSRFAQEHVPQTGSFEEFKSAEQTKDSHEFEVIEQIQSIQIDQTNEPDIVLVDSPVFADDESEPLELGNIDEFEVYETFTMENPGNFEIQITSK